MSPTDDSLIVGISFTPIKTSPERLWSRRIILHFSSEEYFTSLSCNLVKKVSRYSVFLRNSDTIGDKEADVDNVTPPVI
ncbi:hypothetical protein E2C01_053418 [Portunus trituberculatus]|uniref:Uncharacterized protein n=1 Tax=Portunus trituberculatus TaxID=210409 RepID=A0A5B7GP56_PORTR|nr:hypothetical protein [Portunus trituberculatus]